MVFVVPPEAACRSEALSHLISAGQARFTGRRSSIARTNSHRCARPPRRPIDKIFPTKLNSVLLIAADIRGLSRIICGDLQQFCIRRASIEFIGHISCRIATYCENSRRRQDLETHFGPMAACFVVVNNDPHSRSTAVGSLTLSEITDCKSSCRRFGNSRLVMSGERFSITSKPPSTIGPASSPWYGTTHHSRSGGRSRIPSCRRAIRDASSLMAAMSAVVSGFRFHVRAATAPADPGAIDSVLGRPSEHRNHRAGRRFNGQHIGDSRRLWRALESHLRA